MGIYFTFNAFYRKLWLMMLFLIATTPVFSQINASFNFDGVDRTYIVYLPQGYTQAQAFPLLLSLHGLTQTGAGIMEFSGFNAVADTGNFIVVYPDGIANAWNVGFSGGSTADDVGFLSALIDTLHAQYNIDLNRVYSTGFSNGGFMSYRLACEAGNRIAAIAPVSGTMTVASLAACIPSRPMPVLHIHGTNDFVVSYNGGFGNTSVEQVLDFWNSFNNCPGTPVIENLPDVVAEGSTVQRQTWSPCNEGVAVELLKVINGGHTWPGSIGVTGIGITNRDINASAEIWNFVKNFALDETIGIKQATINEIKVYPNPVSDGILFLEIPFSASYSNLQIFDLRGRILQREQIIGQNPYVQVNISGLSRGVYIARLSGNQQIAVARFMVR
jgi:polyhydroxybutyrate depolymerase